MAIIPTSGEFVKVPGGGGGGAFVVTNNNGTLDKTWAEIAEACETNVVVLRDGIAPNCAFGYLWTIHQNESTWVVTFLNYVVSSREEHWVQYTCIAHSEDGYPVHG